MVQRELGKSVLAAHDDAFGIKVRVFVNGSGDRGSITCRVIPKTQNMVVDVSLLNIIRHGSRVYTAIQVKEWHLPLRLGLVAIEKGSFRSPSSMIGQLLINTYLTRKKNKG